MFDKLDEALSLYIFSYFLYLYIHTFFERGGVSYFPSTQHMGLEIVCILGVSIFNFLDPGMSSKDPKLVSLV